MSILETLLHGGLGLANMYYQSSALFADKQTAIDANDTATKAYVAKTIEEYFAGRIDGKQTVANGINALVDNKLTGYLDNAGVSPIISKGIGLFASSIAGNLMKGIEDGLFTGKDTLDTAERELLAKRRMPEPDKGMLAKLTDLVTGKAVDSAVAPLGGGLLKHIVSGVSS